MELEAYIFNLDERNSARVVLNARPSAALRTLRGRKATDILNAWDVYLNDDDAPAFHVQQYFDTHCLLSAHRFMGTFPDVLECYKALWRSVREELPNHPPRAQKPEFSGFLSANADQRTPRILCAPLRIPGFWHEISLDELRRLMFLETDEVFAARVNELLAGACIIAGDYSYKLDFPQE